MSPSRAKPFLHSIIIIAVIDKDGTVAEFTLSLFMKNNEVIIDTETEAKCKRFNTIIHNLTPAVIIPRELNVFIRLAFVEAPARPPYRAAHL